MGEAFFMNAGGGVIPIGEKVPMKCAIGQSIKKGNFITKTKNLDITIGQYGLNCYFIARNLNMFLIYDRAERSTSSVIKAYDLTSFELLWEETSVKGSSVDYCVSKDFLCTIQNQDSGYPYYYIYKVSRDGVSLIHSNNVGYFGQSYGSASIAASDNHMVFYAYTKNTVVFNVVSFDDYTRTTYLSPVEKMLQTNILYVGENLFISTNLNGSGSYEFLLLTVNNSGKLEEVASTVYKEAINMYAPIWIPQFGTIYAVSHNDNDIIKISYSNSSISIKKIVALGEQVSTIIAPPIITYWDFPEAKNMLASDILLNKDGTYKKLDDYSPNNCGIDFFRLTANPVVVDLNYTDHFILGNDSIIAMGKCEFGDSSSVAIKSV